MPPRIILRLTELSLWIPVFFLNTLRLDLRDIGLRFIEPPSELLE